MLFNSVTVKNDIPLKYDELKLNFFTAHTNGTFNDKRVYLLYGNNGVGKTTLSRTLHKFNVHEDDESIVFKDYNEKVIDLDENPLIFVYNEDYINERFIFKSDDNLNAIIMTEEIENIQEQIDKYQGNYEKLKKDLDAIEDDNLKMERAYYDIRERILSALKGRDSWAERDSKIRNKFAKQNTSVTEQTLKIFKPFFEKYKSELFDEEGLLKSDYKTAIGTLQKKNLIDKKKYEDQLTKVRKIEKIERVTLNYPNIEDVEEEVTDILKATIEEKEIDSKNDQLTEKIVQVYRKKGKEYLNSSLCTLEEHKEAGENFCPTCFSNLDENHLSELRSQINNLLSEEAKNYEAQKLIKQIENKYLAIISDKYIEIDDKIKKHFTIDYEDLVQEIDDFNEVVKGYNSLLKEKTEKLYIPVEINSEYSLNQRFINLTSCINKINEKVASHNKSLEASEQLIEDSQTNNNEWSFFELFDIFFDYFKYLEKYNKNELENDTPDSEINKLRSELSGIKDQIRDLEARKKQTGIAVDKINEKLNHITYNDGYLKILPKDDKYYVLVNDNEISLNKLSTGQRNMISLCYFFTQINENQSRDTLYQEEILVILDDPVSSFDHSNKVGIMSLLRYEVGKMLLSNKGSKILIQTHDPGVIFDLEKVVSDIEEERKINKDKYPNIEKISSLSKELRNVSTNPIKKYTPANDYLELVTNVYEFATGKYDEDENNPIVYSIGNNARRILEAYSTFNYNKNFTFLTNSEDILETLDDDSLSDYYKSFMNRLVLNNESHLKEKVQLVSESNSMPSFSYDEKKRVARDTICFLYLIDPLHIKNNLRNFNDTTEQTIKWWVINDK